MEDKDKLRKADIVTGIILVALGLFIISEAFEMPMQASYGGVQNVWYVSPALMPLIIGAALVILGVVLSVNGARYFGWSNTVRMAKGMVRLRGAGALTPKTLRAVMVVVLLIIYVYLNVPRVDFFLSTWLFLFVFVTAYYFDDDALFRKLIGFYLAGTALFFLYFVTGAHAALQHSFRYTTDILTLLFIVAYGVYAWVKTRSVEALHRKYRISFTVSLLVPLILVPVFKFFLLIPLPVEGGIIGLMSLVRYAVF